MESIPDSDTVILARGAAPAVRIGYAFPFSVYQHLMHLLRQPPGDDGGGGVYAAPVQKLRALYFPIGPFNVLELGAARSATTAELGAELRARAAALAQGIAAAVSDAEAAYRAQHWPEHGPMLAAALGRAHALLAPHKDELLVRLADALGIRAQPDDCAGYEVNLVPICHEPTGGYSHPTVVSVAVFHELHLVEAILHELAHVMMHGAREAAGTLAAAMTAAAARRNRPARVAMELLHLIVFYATGELVRERYGEHHVPHAHARKLYARAAALLRANVSEQSIAAIWAQRGQGIVAMAELLLDSAASQTQRASE
jgi:hypothetical protein